MMNDIKQEEQLKDKVVIAMSGGVDSSVAALILAKEMNSEDLVGVSMQVWDYRNNGGCSSRATCCAPSDFADARSVAHKIGIPYYVFDFEEHFHEKVIKRFIDTYAAGKTPNPCVDCNNEVKFKELRNRSESLGCKAVATGHYAAIRKNNGDFRLFRGKDDQKDQSYFLYGLKQDELKRTVFPLADLTKDEVRELAREAGLLTAEKPESQDICFVSGSAQDFVGKRLKSEQVKKGYIKTVQGKILAEHDGIYRFTVGQRKGIGVSGSDRPLYVVEIDPETSSVYVGYEEDLEVSEFVVSDLNWISPDLIKAGHEFEFEAIAQVRHKHRGVPVRVEVKGNEAKVFFKGDWTSAAPGQAAVFYCNNNSELLGGGRIQSYTRAIKSDVISPLYTIGNIARSDELRKEEVRQ